MATMNRISRIAAITRAVEGFVTGKPTPQRHVQVALYSVSSNFNSSPKSHWFSSDRLTDHLGHSNCAAAHGMAGTMLFSVAAAQEVHAKEPRQSKEFMPNEVVLYQYEACPFCNKVKAFLDYYDVPYKVVEVNPINKKEIKWSDYKKVPILMVDGEKMVDSSDIVDKLFQKIHPEIPVDSVSNDEGRKWRG
ncbi:unnamed protein product, partial [Ilex paraguariensis]